MAVFYPLRVCAVLQYDIVKLWNAYNYSRRNKPDCQHIPAFSGIICVAFPEREYFLAILSWIILLLFSEVSAVESRLVTSTGEAAIANITPEEAQELALKRARLNAIEKVCVIKLQAETFVRNLEVEADFIHSVSYGHIVSEEILRWDVDVDQESLIRPPAITYRVSIKTEVLKEQGEPDPFYQVNVKLNKKKSRSVFRKV